MARLFINNLTVIDFSFLDKHRGVVGESWIVDIELIGELDDQGMVFDFGAVKKDIKRFIDAEVDHRLLVPTAAIGCKTRISDDELSVEFPLACGAMILHQSPCNAVLLLEADKINAAHIAQRLQSQLKALLPDNVGDVIIKLRNEHIDGAYYQYTHGLRDHLGQCQRIAHGHRSRIEIEIDGKRNQQLEALWASRLADSYIATENHVMEAVEINGIMHKRLAYTAAQGYFSISVPNTQLFIIPSVSTVENIAIYLAESIATENGGKVLVKAFEGLEKGAFGDAYFGQNGIKVN